MNKIFLLVCLTLFLSCQTKSISSALTKENSGIKPEDCPVPQEGQNDDFLKGIDVLKNYKWNAITKKAHIKINKSDDLIITRGGCIHFIVDAEFHPKQKINLENNYQAIFKEVIWVAKLIKDFNYNLLSKEIVNKNYSVFTNQYVTTITFSNKELLKFNYAIIINTKKNTFSISQFLQ